MKRPGTIAIGTLGTVGTVLTSVVFAYALDGNQSAASSSLSSVLNSYEDIAHAELSLLLDDGTEVGKIYMQEHRDWILLDGHERTVSLNQPALKQYISTSLLPEFVLGKAEAATDKGWLMRSDIVSIPKGGFAYRLDDVTETIERALLRGWKSVTIEAEKKEPTLTYNAFDKEVQLTLLSRGLSDFEGSDFGRDANVRKALYERLDGIYISPGETFSFNNAIAGSSGWSDAYVIVNGGELQKEPGGGICQSTTTMYRAALLAGLPIIKRANHSLYVTHYEEYGVGLDATVYPGKQDFEFVNDTPGPIVVVSRAEGDMAIVELYGIDDGRRATLQGPYFSEAKQPGTLLPDLRINQIGWRRAVVRADGKVVDEDIVSTYRAIPRTLHETYGDLRGI